MKKIISISIVCAFVSLITGCQLGYMGACKKYQKGEDFYKLYDLLEKKSNLADTIMSNNDVYDMDGSDNMADYLHISTQIDSIYNANKLTNLLLRELVGSKTFSKALKCTR